MEKAIIYCRVSSQDQTHGTSLENQQRACAEYALHKGLKVIKVFIEKGESATAANRTELIKALDYCKEQKGEVVAFIVWKLDRFARNPTDHYALQAQLLKYGTTLHSVSEPIISEGPVGQMLEAVLAGYAKFENDVRKQRCEGGMRARLRDGIRPWHPPLGYIHSKNRTDRRKLTPDQPDSERFYLVQKGLRRYATGEVTIVQLTVESNNWGLRTATGRPMSKQLWERILTDKFYCGILTDPWSTDEYRGLHTPMISLEEFERIQVVKRGLSNNATNRRLLYHPDFPLRGTVRCACGSFLTASWQKGRNKHYPYYRCHNSKCPHRGGLNKKVLEKKFAQFLKRITPQEDFLKLFERVVIDEWQNQHTAATLERADYQRRIASVDEQKRQLIAMRAAKEITKEELAEMRGALDNQLTGLRIAQNEALTTETELEVSLAYAKQFIINVARQWQDLDEPARRAHLQKLVLPEGIAYDKKRGTFGTAVLSPVFKLNQEYGGKKSDLVAGAGFAPATFRL